MGFNVTYHPTISCLGGRASVRSPPEAGTYNGEAVKTLKPLGPPIGE